MWFTAIVAIVSFPATLYMATRRPPPAVAPAPEDVKGPTVEEGTAIPVVFGTVIVESPIVVWYGDVISRPVKKDGYTIGHNYCLNMFLIICHGILDSIRDVLVDKQSIMEFAEQNTITPNRYLIPDKTPQFHVEGMQYSSQTLFLNPGETSNAVNPGVAHRLGSYWGGTEVPSGYPLTSGFFGLATAQIGNGIKGQFSVGMNPVMRAWSFIVTRIHLRHEGVAQWYDETAQISVGRGREQTWKYKMVTDISPEQAAIFSDPYYDDSAWDIEQGGFGNTGANGYEAEGGAYLPRTLTYVSPGSGNSIWVRWDFGPLPPVELVVECFHDDGGDLWFNGTKIELTEINYFRSTAIIPSSLIMLNGPNVIAFRTIDCYKNGVPAGNSTYIYNGLTVGVASGDDADLRASALNDLNPIHIIRECLTNPNWGRGVEDDDIDDTAFRYAADVCFSERLGMSILWSKQASIGDFIKEILRHIDGALYVSRTTGKYTIKLIRGDYVVNDLITLDSSSIVSVDNFSRKVIGDLTNSVTVKFTDQLTGGTQSATVFEQGLITAQGGISSTVIDYPGFSNPYIANKIALRDLRTLSAPVVSCTIVASRKASRLNEGDAFKFTRTEYGVENLIMRVISIELGDGRNNSVKITAIEDVFSSPLYTLQGNSGVVWNDPSDVTPPTAGKLLQIEEPYSMTQARLGAAELEYTLAVKPDVGFLVAGSERMSGAIDADLYISPPPASAENPFSLAGKMDLCPFCMISANTTLEEGGAYAPYLNAKRFPTQTQTVFNYNSEKDLDFVVIGSYAILVARNGDAPLEVRAHEFVKVVGIDLEAKTVTLGRGCMDTVPIDYSKPNSQEQLPELYFLDNYFGTNGVQYVTGDKPRAWVSPSNSKGSAALPANLEALFEPELIMEGRLARPYPPAHPMINNVAFPISIARTGDLVFTWRGRNKISQGAALIASGDEHIAEEIGTTYTLLLRDEGGNIFKTVTGIEGRTYTYTNAAELYDLDLMSDPYASNTVALLHLNTDFTDETGKSWSNGTATISTAQKVFGAGSCLSTSTSGATKYASDSSDWAFGNGDFTVELRCRVTDLSTGGFYESPIGNWASGTGWCFFVTPTGELRWYYPGFGLTVPGVTIALNTWYALAVTRISGVTRVFVNGTLMVTTAVQTSNINSTTAPRIGGNGVSTDNWRGYVDEVRITKGVGRYSATYTPATSEFNLALPTSHLQAKLFLELSAVNGALTSFSKQTLTLLRPGFGRNFGKFFGGGAA